MPEEVCEFELWLKTQGFGFQQQAEALAEHQPPATAAGHPPSAAPVTAPAAAEVQAPAATPVTGQTKAEVGPVVQPPAAAPVTDQQSPQQQQWQPKFILQMVNILQQQPQSVP